MTDHRTCEIVQDLIRLGNQASRASIRMVTDHVRDCPECRQVYEKQVRPRRRGPHLTEGLRNLLAWKRYSVWSLLALASLTVALCMTVDYSTERRITWGWIVAGGMACSAISYIVYLQTYTYRFIKAMIAFSILAMLQQGVIQLVLYNGMHIGGVWIWRVAVPVTAIWLAVVWIAVLMTFLLKKNGFHCLGWGFLLCVPASIATTAIAVAYTGDRFSVDWVGLSVFSVLAALNLWGAWRFEKRTARRENGRGDADRR